MTLCVRKRPRGVGAGWSMYFRYVCAYKLRKRGRKRRGGGVPDRQTKNRDRETNRQTDKLYKINFCVCICLYFINVTDAVTEGISIYGSKD